MFCIFQPKVGFEGREPMGVAFMPIVLPQLILSGGQPFPTGNHPESKISLAIAAIFTLESSVKVI